MPFKEVPPLYGVWQSMRRRCLTPSTKQFEDYGGRGSSICKERDSFEKFAADMGIRPPGTTLDRIDNNGNYEPSNCRWATRREQQRNRRMTIRVEIEGQSYLLIELAEMAGHKAETISARIAAGLSFEKIISRETFQTRRVPVEAVAARIANQKNATHCKNGHEWTPENTRITKEGWKNCRACHNMKMRNRTAMKRRAANLSP